MNPKIIKKAASPIILLSKKKLRNITDCRKRVYFANVGVQIGNQGKGWVPHTMCYVFVENLSKWFKKDKKVFKFAIPMRRREQKKKSFKRIISKFWI